MGTTGTTYYRFLLDISYILDALDVDNINLFLLARHVGVYHSLLHGSETHSWETAGPGMLYLWLKKQLGQAGVKHISLHLFIHTLIL